MLLTLKPSVQNGCSSPHAYSPPPAASSKISTHSAIVGSTSLPPLPDARPRRMSTPHRGLPPPLGMTLPNPERTQPPAPLSQPMGNLPAPPSQWQGADESMRNWLAAKAEEDKRKQEEEKTRQETLKLEQRRIEQTMLRESLQGGVPPHMVPMVFAGMGGGNMANASVEWAQHYMAQISLQQQQQQQHIQQPPQPQSLPPPQASPDIRRDRSTTGPQPNPYGSQQPSSSSTALVQQQASQVPSYQAHYQMPTLSTDRLRQGAQGMQAAAAPTSMPRLPGQSSLSRLNTGEMQIQAPPQGAVQISGHHPLQQSTTAQQQEQQSTSPSIYFHHWVPPSSQKDPPGSATKSQHSSPYSQNTSSHLRSEYVNSPKKRKTTSSHASGPSHSSRTPETSPRISQLVSSGRRRAHSNQQSDTSSRSTHEVTGQSASRPASRARQRSTSDAESGNQTLGPVQDETSSSRDTGSERKRTGSGTPKGDTENPP
ncbi:MAG: hypothetical protein MMC23_009813 [Stictis urceolatum]|nr:hypothetical protein [Stictis urceolata]